MTGTLFALTAAVLLAGDSSTDKSPRSPHPSAPSLPKLTDDEEKTLDTIIDRFMDYDVGKLRGKEGLKARQDFERLGPEAIPALLRGIHRAAGVNDSCPVVVISYKLGRLLGSTQDTKLLQFARDELAGVGPTRHAAVVQDLRVGIMLRRNALLRAGVAELKPANPLMRQMSTADLVEAATKERGQRLKQVLLELAQRPGDDPLSALGIAAASYERDVQQYARNLLVQNLSRQTPTFVKEKLADDKAEVRLAAARVAVNRNLPVVSELIDQLADSNENVREFAHQTLVRVARGTDYGPKKGADKEERDKAVEKWRTWWTRQGGR